MKSVVIGVGGTATMTLRLLIQQLGENASANVPAIKFFYLDLPFDESPVKSDSLDPLPAYLSSNSEMLGKLMFSVAFLDHGGRSHSGLVDISEDITRETVASVFAEPKRLYRMTYLGFERFVAEIYRGLGFEVRSTKRSHDGGVDLYLERNVSGMVHSYVVQCKYREAPKRKIGVSAARELLGTLVDKAVTAGILVTNYLFSPTAQRIIKSHSTRLFGIDGKGLFNLMATYLAATAA